MDDILSRILIVDDNKDIHEDIKYILDSSIPTEDQMVTQSLRKELFGEDEYDFKLDKDYKIRYRIDDAYQGEEAIRMVLKALEEGYPYSLIFMDVRMPPGMDGVEAIKAIWKIEPTVEVVICTAYSDYSWDQIVAKLGQNDHLLFLRKPFDNVSVKQLTLTMTTKWDLQNQNRNYINNLEAEVEKRTSELNIVIEKLTDEMTLREEKEMQLAHIAHYDSLTDLLNRHSFYDFISKILNNPSDNEFIYKTKTFIKPFSILFIDIDGFKKVNDDLGHDIGDRVLTEISKRIKFFLHDYAYDLSTAYEKALCSKGIFRFGGDEFIAILSEGDKKRISKIVAMLIEKIREPYYILNHDINISCSIGISIYPDDSVSPDVLLKYADIAMYEAKKVKSTYIFHENPNSISFQFELSLKNDLENALTNNELELYYQYLINPKDEIIGLQSLLRWHHPKLGMLKPDEFIYIAEKSGQMLSIGKYIIETAINVLNMLQTKFSKELFMLVNCTISQFYDPNFIKIVKDSLFEAEVDPKFLKIGLEESFTVQASDESLTVINELNKIGVQFTLDSFKNLYPTFAYLQHLPKDTIIKLNKEFISSIAENSKNRTFFLNLLDTFKSLDLKVIISGIENSEQKDLLIKKDCILQGYHFNVPKPFEEILTDFSLRTK